MRWLAVAVLAACGRLGFTPDVTTHTPPDAPHTTDGPAPAPITWEGTVVARDFAGSSDTVSAVPHAAGDVFVFDFSCTVSGVPAAASLTAPGWTITSLAPIITDPSHDYASAAFVATAPDVTTTTFTLSWGGTVCPDDSSELADEFANTSGSDAVVQTDGTGDCTATLVTGHAGDAVWAACFSSAGVGASGAGYTAASKDGAGDATEYLITDDPAGTTETPTFGNAGNEYTMVAVALQPR